jgi:hypothetical protein
MSTIKANTLLHSDGTTTTQPSIPALDKRMAKAWVNFNGTGTVAIRDSYNVSSITDEATGQYRINFSTALANSNYSTALGSGGSGGGSAFTRSDGTTTSFDYNSYNASSTTYVDIDTNNAVVFGN